MMGKLFGTNGIRGVFSDDFNLAKDNIMKNLDKLNWSGGFYRKDIGYKVLK